MPRCKHCKTKFEPKQFNQKNCLQTDECVRAFLSDLSKQNEQRWRKEKKVRKNKLKTRSEWLNDLQKTFNTYIRERDKNKPCVSCGVDLRNKTVHASHFWSVGAYPRLRFNENNVHASCDHCNLHLHGNIANYALRLPERIGQAAFDELNSSRNGAPLKLTTDEIKANILIYKEKTKNLI
jgi:hypothetical protein